MRKRLLSVWTAVMTALVLTACGGGDAGGNAASAAATSDKALVSGTVTGFGSVYVEGVRYEDRNAKVQLEEDSTAPRSGALSDIKLGMKVELSGSSTGDPSTVTVAAELVGPIASLSSDGFVVAGQNVKVSTDPAAPTVFENVAGVAGLAVGDRVEVHGSRDGANGVLASRVELKDPRLANFVRVVGNVSGHDAAARTFRLGNQAVSYSAATRIRPAGVTVADGQTVAVWADGFTNAGVLLAKGIAVRGSSANIGDSVRVGGHIRELDFTGKRFKVDGFTVDAASAVFANGTVSDLANGRRVRVAGAAQNGLITAAEVRFVRNQGDSQVELAGVVTDFVSNASFKVRGVPVDASGSGVTFVDGTVANLGEGVLVRLVGQVDGAAVKPTRVEFAQSEGDGSRTLFGIVSNYSSQSGDFVASGLSMRLADNASFRNSDGSAAVRADFGDQDRIRAKGIWQAGRFIVTEVVFQPAPGMAVFRSEGGVYEFEAARGAFRLNGTLVIIDGTTQFEGMRENLRNGVRVEVEGTWVDGRLIARKIEIKLADDAVRASVKGAVTDYVSASDFRVAGQRVNASQAVLRSGSLERLTNGSSVEARGNVVDGVLIATELRFQL